MGNLRFDVLQGARMNHFTVLEAWRDERAREAHISGTHTRTYREGLRETAVDGAPYDERSATACCSSVRRHREVRLKAGHYAQGCGIT